MKEQKKIVKYRDLPAHLQKKYKNSLIFQKASQHCDKKFQFNMDKLIERKAEKQKTMEEKLQEFEINPHEQKYLLLAFDKLSENHNYKYFTDEDVMEILRKMGVKMAKTDVERMVWEFDQHLNKKITKKEYINMYKRCTIDKAAAQSKNLFHLTQFLMYCRPNTWKVTVEDTLELLFVRAKIEVEKEIIRPSEQQIISKLQLEIKVLFQGEEKTEDGQEKEITFEQYLERINKRAIKKRKKELKRAKNALKYPKDKVQSSDEDI